MRIRKFTLSSLKRFHSKVSFVIASEAGCCLERPASFLSGEHRMLLVPAKGLTWLGQQRDKTR